MKMGYLNESLEPFPLSDYEVQLNNTLSTLPDGSPLSLLMQILEHDRAVRYEMIARYIPLEMEQMLQLLRSFIREIKKGEDILSQADEDEIQRVTDALLERGKELLLYGKPLEASDAGFSILLTIEPELTNVYDEGITFQVIIDETFGFLQSIAQQKYNTSTAALLLEKATRYYASRQEIDCFYDDEWLELIKLFESKQLAK